MNILDEDIVLSQRRSLESMKVHFRQIGVEIGPLRNEGPE